ncbi:MAG TPA: hypothetical protein VEB66_00275 [Opitutaceae bacterium]|nr:hypothetical protein [Opitutaceae bacterium]
MNAAVTFAPELPIPAVAASSGARSALRFTVDGDPALENHLAHVCALVRTGVRRLLGRRAVEGVLLGGGYGRGEGGVLRTPAGDRPYNDLEFYVLLRGSAVLNEIRWGRALAALGHELSAAAGVEVEFKVLSRCALRRGTVSMFSYDLVAGHRWVCGHETLLEGCAHHGEGAAIPLAEATRLLMNRCSGLLFARERLDAARFGPEDADFVARNLAKARLALGDAVLAVFGRYHWSCRERARRLSDLPASRRMPWLEAVRAAHADGVAFKLHPALTRRGADELAADLAALAQLASRVWLWVESRRLGVNFASPLEYALHPAALCPETAPARNVLVNLRRFGWRGLAAGATRYPRERLLRALPVLLWHPAAAGEPPLQARLQRWLRCGGTAGGCGRAYRALWEVLR